MLTQENVRKALSAADAGVISIGGNDLFQGGRTLANRNDQQFATVQTRFNQQLAEKLDSIRQWNPRAPVYECRASC